MADFPYYVGDLKIEPGQVAYRNFYVANITIRILEKFSKPSWVKFGVPSSIKDRSVKYRPRYGIQGGSHLCKASRRDRNLPSDETIFCNFSIVCFVCK